MSESPLNFESITRPGGVCARRLPIMSLPARMMPVAPAVFRKSRRVGDMLSPVRWSMASGRDVRSPPEQREDHLEAAPGHCRLALAGIVGIARDTVGVARIEIAVRNMRADGQVVAEHRLQHRVGATRNLELRAHVADPGDPQDEVAENADRGV